MSIRDKAKEFIEGQESFKKKRPDYKQPFVFQLLFEVFEELERVDKKLDKAEDILLELSGMHFNFAAKEYFEGDE